MGKKLTNKDLRHVLLEIKQKSVKKGPTEKSQSRGSKSQRWEKSHSEVHTKDRRSSKATTREGDKRNSSSSHHSLPSSNGSSTEGNDDDEDLGSADENGEYKVKDLRKALKKMLAEKEPRSGLAVDSPFTKKVRDSPLLRSYRGVGDLKFDETTDPVEYLRRKKCRLLGCNS